MTKEELEKEAEGLFEFPLNYKEIEVARHSGFINGYLAGAEPREKQIERLSKEVDDLENMKATLESRVAELEQQIEKMKCCSNCDNWNWKHSKCEKKLKGDCFKQSKWILRR